MKLLIVLSLAVTVRADILIGCWSSISTLGNGVVDQYQAPSLCAKSCPNSPYLGLYKGSTCYCLDGLPSGSQGGSCNIPCFGFGTETCGGSNAYNVYQNPGVSVSSSAVLSSTSLSSSLSSSSSSSSTTAAPSSSDTSDTSSSQTIFTSTQTQGNDIVTKTITSGSSGTSTHSPSSSSASGENKKKSSNTGPIVGGVVGGLGALVLIGVGIFFFMKHRNSEYEDEEEFYDKPTGPGTLGAGLGGSLGRGNTAKGSRKNASPLDMPMANPFVHPNDATVGALPGSGLVDPRLNPIMMGRRRLSEGSLADGEDYLRKILAVANP